MKLRVLNKSGFNLFTALVSFLLIMLAVLLIQSMIKAERDTADEIARIESSSQLEAVAEMARADALQVFNYSLRKKIEEWLTDPDRGELTLQLQNKSWNDIKKEFAESKFGGSQSEAFATFTSNALIGIFYTDAHFGNYKISLEGRETLKKGIQDAVLGSMDDFFTVIECGAGAEEGDPRYCEKGTFYVNLHLENLSQEQYEQLPRLYVIDKATGEELKMIMLPKTTFRIYVPLRFFKAIAETRALMHYPLEETDTQNDKGLFSPMIHNMMEEMGLGMCDYGYCAPRTNPFTPPESTEMAPGEFCPGNNLAPGYQNGIATGIECPAEWANCPASYNANNNDGSADMKTKLALFAKSGVCKVVKDAKEAGYLDAEQGDKFNLAGTGACDNGLVSTVEVNVFVNDSKSVVIKNTFPAPPGGFSGSADPYSCSKPQMVEVPRRIGLYSEGAAIKFPNIALSELPCEGTFGDAVCSDCKGACAEVKSIKVTLAFKEEDPDYMVTKAGSPGSHDKVYKISVYDNGYVPFTGQFDQGAMSGCLYGTAPNKQGCSLNAGAGWYCASTYDGEQFGTSAATLTGCRPA